MSDAAFGSAIFSPCGLYRYRLTRRFRDTGPLLPWIMLNPSIGTATQDDPTIRRIYGFSKREGAAGFVLGNIYGYRSTDPAKLAQVDNPIGPANIDALTQIADEAVRDGMPIVCAWGAGAMAWAAEPVIALLKAHRGRLVCLGYTNGGHPRHPLYVGAKEPFRPFVDFPATVQRRTAG